MSDSSVFRVRLVKRKQSGFGFIVKQRATPPRLVVSELVKNGEAEECGLVKPGDLILGVDGKDVTEMVYEAAVELLRSTAVGKPIEILIRVPKEQKVRLETTYGQDGLPRIVRVTEGSDKIPTIDKSPKKQVFNNEGLNESPAKALPANNTQSPRSGGTVSSLGPKTPPTPVRKINQVPDKPKQTSKIDEANKNSPIPERKNMVTSIAPNNEIPVRKIERPVAEDESNGGDQQQRACFGATLQPFNVNQGRRWSATRLVAQSPERPKDLSPEKSSTTTRSLKSVRLRNMMTGAIAVDTLCKNAIENVQCSDKVCLGSLMALPRRAPGTARSKEELIDHAKRFFDEYYTSSKRYNSPAHIERWLEVTKDIETTGTYDLKETELIYGAKLAWRNAVRCIGRIQWTKLQVFDARYVSCTLDMFHAICNHIKYATNKGNIRSTITVFPHRTDPKHDYRVWNPQLISYAGFRQPDGTVIGDPAATDFTDLCIRLGWKPKREKWEILPLLLQANGKDPELYELPEDIILRVKITHPKYKVYEDMDIEWYALPAVSGMLFDCGGLEFPGAPFNGWYMVTEIGSRDFCDPHRFNMLEPLANGMGFDTSNNSSLWKDKTMTEVNYAVLNSFQKANVTIVDHHTLADSFRRHWETEQRVRGGCPADWVWHIPPVSGSLMWIFHQELAYYHLKPSYEYQEGAWKTHVWEKDKGDSKPSPRKLRFKDIVKAVKFTSNLFGKALSKRIKATILFATETGHSEDFANILGNIFSYAFNVQVICMADYNISDLEHESLLLVVTSTFGNGDPPEKGESFARALQAIRITGETTPDLSNMSISTSFVRINSMSSEGKRLSKQLTRSSSMSNSEEASIGPMSSIRYAVFALGSSAYPNFCAFGHFVNSLLGDLGGERISDIGLGDELCGQEHSFREWASSVFQASLDVFCIDDDVNIKEMKDSLKGAVEWAPDKVRIVPSEREVDTYEELSRMSHRDVKPCKLIRSTSLHPTEDHRRTMLFELSTNYTGFNFVPGDHLAIFPANRIQLVNKLLERLKKMCPDSDSIIEAQTKSYKQTLDGVKTIWTTQERIPPCSLRTALTRFLDITTPPSQKLLSLMVHYAKSEKDKKQLLTLSTQMQMYEEWKAHNYPNFLEVLEEFTTVDLDPAFLLINLPTVQARFYSISSSPDAFPNEVHATVAIVTYRTKGGDGPVHYGVCSNYLASLNVGEPVPCFIRSDPSFSLPDNPTVPIVMVGPGTGIAPFRGFWQQRAVDKKKLQYDGVQFGPMLLYFGCRTSTVELYRDEIEMMMQECVISKHFVAFSRQSNKPKCYVQDIMWEQTSQSLYNHIVTMNGHFYVCGDVTMADCVSKTLIEIFQKHGNLSSNDAERYLYTMKEQNRFHDDIFGITLRTAEKTRKVRIQAQQKHNENTSSMDN